MTGSPPPLRAATMMALLSLPNRAPRFLSWAPLRMAMFAEWEWPAMSNAPCGRVGAGFRSDASFVVLQLTIYPKTL